MHDMTPVDRTAPGLDFLFTTWEGGGHVTPALWAARRLADQGRRVLVMSDQASAPEAASFGLPFRSWTTAPNRLDKDPAHDPVRDWEATTPVGTVGLLADRLLIGPARAYADDVLTVLGDHPGAMVVSQELLIGAMLAAEVAHAPLALLTSNVWPYPTLPGVPPFGPGLAPPETAEDERFQGLIRAASTALYDQQLEPLNRVRAELGLPPLARFAEQLEAPHLILLGASRAFDFAPERLPPRFRYAGPQVRVPHWAAPWSSPWPQDDPRPLVLVCFSTLYQQQEDVLHRVISALGRLDVRGLVTLGPSVSLDDFRDAPDNVVVVESASHDAVMPRVSAFVTHGGHGAVIRPLLHGVPVLCMPMGRDQMENAARVTARGAGLRLDPSATGEEISAAITRVLGDPAYGAAAARLGSAIDQASRADGDVVVRELEAFARHRGRGRPAQARRAAVGL